MKPYVLGISSSDEHKWIERYFSYSVDSSTQEFAIVFDIGDEALAGIQKLKNTYTEIRLESRNGGYVLTYGLRYASHTITSQRSRNPQDVRVSQIIVKFNIVSTQWETK